MPEGTHLEFKELLDPADARDRLILVKEIVAMANAEGGRIRIGVTDDGTIVGIEDEECSKWDLAEIGNLLDRYIRPDKLDIGLTLDPDGCEPGRKVVEVTVPLHPSPPIVLARDGNHGGTGSPVFTKDTVIVRHNTKAERAGRSDYLRWRDELRDRILQQFQMVIQASETAHLRILKDQEVKDEPNFMLSRAADLFRQRPEKLLDGDDLLYLFKNRAGLGIRGERVGELLVHSALRRRATLFFWLALLGLDAGTIRDILGDALQMSDRDKSDMAGVMPLVARLFLREDDYDWLIGRMRESRYAHIRNAAEGFAMAAVAQEAIDRRRSGRIEGRPLQDIGDDELLALADELAAEGNSQRISRRMPSLGLEYLVRRLARHE